MKIGTKVRCEEGFSNYCGYLACIEEDNIYPYIVVLRESDVGKSFIQLLGEYGFGADDFGIFKLEDLTEV